jgi:hypothetical protein
MPKGDKWTRSPIHLWSLIPRAMPTPLCASRQCCLQIITLIWHIPFSARTLLAMYFKGPGASRPFASVTSTATLFQFSSVYTLGGLPGSAMAPDELVYTTLLTDILSYMSEHRQL